MMFRLFLYAVLTVTIGVYAALYGHPLEGISRINTIGFANILALGVTAGILVRPMFFYIWAAYLALISIYFAALHPHFPLVKECIVYGFAAFVVLTMIYDIILRNCKDVIRRSYLRTNAE
ncbi:hypothetical protein OO184_15415 [Photorhabdus sp. APURE]|uniref:hypothetical protein n=1 Tax=Photorhabdus aballayi TaxID=2991723 RepID=UPI00223C8C4A|nr:hypothetical protein [Photorhabdus aballayi]MCW7549281.1 hypothetical protein [Photorhabdus aballayi]